MSASPLFSLVIPVYNGGEPFRRCLAALGSSPFRDWELIVVDDGSDDASASAARAAGAAVLETPGRAGPAAARNLGARAARGEYLLFLDADCEVNAATLGEAARILAAEPELEALFGSYDDEPAARSFIAQYKNLQHHYVHQRGRADSSTFWAGCGAVRRSTFLALGGFDENRYPRPSIEDIELGYRLRRAGARIRLARGVQVKHHKAWTFRGLLRTDLLDRALPWMELILRDRDLVNDLNLDARGRWSAFLAALFPLCLALALVEPACLLGAAAAAVLLVGLNFDLYRFFARKRGLAFTGGAIALHGLYHFYCAGAAGWGFARFLVRRTGGTA
ncbi:MAG TPA: glycosyltransferase [Thermoanaerobaculia bacterium]|jgi:glycosyltransferase involved in cell wall biosynthesis|nr:glycosyltransferase [Thermoanaerobaculia bacterium]